MLELAIAALAAGQVFIALALISLSRKIQNSKW